MAAPSPLPQPSTTNRHMLSAVYAAAADLGQPPYGLIRRAERLPLFYAPLDGYHGPPPEYFFNLTTRERAAIVHHWQTSTASGPDAKTLDHLNLRPGPATDSGFIATLPPNTPLVVENAQGEWLKVHAADQSGFVHKDYVEFGDLSEDNAPLHQRSDLAEISLPPPPAQQLGHNPAQLTDVERLTLETWNRYGNLLTVIAFERNLDPGVVVAVLATESGGAAFAPDGRLNIRFENHIFFSHWGQEHPEPFAAHFRFNPERRWQEHRWRPTAGDEWRPFHSTPETEWQVFDFARRLDETAAICAISMGAPQIMGFNYADTGFESAQAMLRAFSHSEAAQILAFFDFVEARLATTALRRRDFHQFATLYNGPGQADFYAGLIEQRHAAFRWLRGETTERPRGSEGSREIPRPPTPAEKQATQEMVRTILETMNQSHRTTLWMYRLLLGLGMIGILIGIGLAVLGRGFESALAPGLIGLGALLLYVLARPARYLQDSQAALDEVTQMASES